MPDRGASHGALSGTTVAGPAPGIDTPAATRDVGKQGNQVKAHTVLYRSFTSGSGQTTNTGGYFLGAEATDKNWDDCIHPGVDTMTRGRTAPGETCWKDIVDATLGDC